MAKSTKAEHDQVEMLKAWYHDVIAKSAAIEMTNCDNFMTVRMPSRSYRELAAFATIGYDPAAIRNWTNAVLDRHRKKAKRKA